MRYWELTRAFIHAKQGNQNSIGLLLTAPSLVLVLLVAGCGETRPAASAQPEAATAEPDPAAVRRDPFNPYYFISFYKLLARPEDYNGKLIHLHGVLSLSTKDTERLYASMESFRLGTVMDTVAVKFTEAQRSRFLRLDGKYVALKGTFKHTRQDEYAEVGELTSIDQVIDLTEFAERPLRVQ